TGIGGDLLLDGAFGWREGFLPTDGVFGWRDDRLGERAVRRLRREIRRELLAEILLDPIDDRIGIEALLRRDRNLFDNSRLLSIGEPIDNDGIFEPGLFDFDAGLEVLTVVEPLRPGPFEPGVAGVLEAAILDQQGLPDDPEFIELNAVANLEILGTEVLNIRNNIIRVRAPGGGPLQ
ncbi:MAG: hypothetical protein SV108_06465, partial [Pseudomonadota bacterium]|nr:hypothetical protein [Pseudomonadota bacterium]